MRRDLQALASQAFDLIVVGGGIAGISVARDAALRGLSVALVEQGDFASGSTGRTLGMIHGECAAFSDSISGDFGHYRQSVTLSSGTLLISCIPSLSPFPRTAKAGTESPLLMPVSVFMTS